MMAIKKYLILVLALSFSACVSSKPEISFEKPQMQVPKPAPEVKKNKGSLYSRKGPSLFADKKDLQIGDIIQVVISESLTSDTNNKRELTNDRNTSLGGGLITPMSTNTSGLGSTAQKASDSFNRVAGVGFDTTSTGSFKGNIKTQVDESFETTLSVIIEETYANGNYFIKGTKEMLIDEQKQEIIISGVIRPYDISADNSILSSQVANLKVKYMKDGEEQDVMHEAWGTKLLKAIWPF